MRIASKIKRPNAPITIGGETYFFRPNDPSNPDSEHVAEVENEEHIGRFLSITEGYCVAKSEPMPVAARPAKPAAPQKEAPKAPEGAATNTQSADTSGGENKSDETKAQSEAGGLTEEQQEAANKLNALGVAKMREELAAGAIDPAVIAEALRIEEAKAEDDQRSTTIKLLKAELKP